MKTKSRHYEAIALRQVLVEKEIAKKQNKKRFNSPWCDESRKKSNQHKSAHPPTCLYLSAPLDTAVIN